MPNSLPEALRKVQRLSITEAARFLNISAKTLRRWEKQGILVPERTVGNQRRYSLIQLQEFDPNTKRLEIQSSFPKSPATLFSELPPNQPGISVPLHSDSVIVKKKIILLRKLAFVPAIIILLIL